MQCACRNILVTFELIAVSLIATRPLLSQSPGPSDLQPSPYPASECREAGSVRTQLRNDLGAARTFLQGSRGEEHTRCLELLAKAGSPSAARGEVEPVPASSRAVIATKPDPVPRSVGEFPLTDIGEEGTNIVRAREAVLEILKETNTCSEWFRQSDPRIGATFSSLEIEVDEDGSRRVIKERDDRGVWIEHGPYIARARQGAGPGSTITINGNGAFFRNTGGLYKIEWSGSIPNDTGALRYLHIGPFHGGSLQGQVIALLHELAHVVGAAPSDDTSVVGFELSQENTNLILRHCRTQASAVGKRNKLMAAQR